MAGMEAGFSPFASATGVHIIEGKPAFSSNLLAQAVRRHPVYDYRVIENTATVCRIQFTANGQPLGMSDFTMEMAKRAGLATKAIWQKYPEAMLFSRALTAGMRTHCPDALGGHPAYTPEELGDAEVVPVTVTEPAPVIRDAVDLTDAQQACDAAGLTPDGLIGFCLMVSNGRIPALADLPAATLARITSQGISAETVAKCNADAAPATDPEPTEDPDDLPAAWSA
jgi:hypothetical protein